MYSPLRRGTLLICTPVVDDPDKKHLFVLLTDPCGKKGNVLLVSLSSWKDDGTDDPACVLEPSRSGHRFIVKKSFVRYSRLRIEVADKLGNGVNSGRMSPMEPMPIGDFQRIIDGVFTSRHSEPRFKNFLKLAIR